ncbi:glycosyltransferase family 4 protein [Salinivibrio sp. AR640]|uniref:glycosyltransferase family 4 protein n=1 Tax=Salinivibrio sp. AR640 TaxID=1909437 RepID=UPI0009855DC5|nr:glycosyltransferase family 4 protein [Salinivibrio sp. AR640]OOE94680.1 group 1 glycosyl transferase [Salinivibrio sp. AR640]
MKIALVHLRHAYSGGVELYLNKMAAYLAKNGEDVSIICRSHADKPPHPSVKFVKLRGFSLGKSHRLWQFARAVEKHVKDEDYDIVYGLAHAWTHDVLRIGAGTSYYMSQSLNQRMRLKDWVTYFIERKAMKPGNYYRVICNSYKSSREVQYCHNVPDDKISVIHNFVDTYHFDARRVKNQSDYLKNNLGVNFENPVFLFLGTGYERKGLRKALVALSMMTIDAHLLIVGRDSNEIRYIELAKKLGVDSKCTFIGEDMRPELYFSIADCYVLPTLYEPFGFTVIESLSCGTPAITTDNCGAKEVITPEVSSVISHDVKEEDLSREMEFWAYKKRNTSVSKKCREVACKLDVSVVLENNYQELKAVYRLKNRF